MALAPVPNSPETAPHTFETKTAPSRAGNRGPLRYEEGLGTDPGVSSGFTRGATEGFGTDGRQSDVDRETQFKHAAETMQQRAHPGSAAWPEAPTYTTEFASEANADWDEPSYKQVDRSGGRYERTSPARIV